MNLWSYSALYIFGFLTTFYCLRRNAFCHYRNLVRKQQQEGNLTPHAIYVKMTTGDRDAKKLVSSKEEYFAEEASIASFFASAVWCVWVPLYLFIQAVSGIYKKLDDYLDGRSAVPVLGYSIGEPDVEDFSNLYVTSYAARMADRGDEKQPVYKLYSDGTSEIVPKEMLAE